MRFSADVRGSGDEFFRQACALGLEGAVSKRADSTYRGGVRTRDWVKVKCARRQEMVIGGFTDPQGSRNGFGALLLGVYEKDGTLRYSGKVGTGFNERTLASLRAQARSARAVHRAPFANPPRGFEAKGAHWVKPQLVAEIAFTEWTQDGTLAPSRLSRACATTRKRPRSCVSGRCTSQQNDAAQKPTIKRSGNGLVDQREAREAKSGNAARRRRASRGRKESDADGTDTIAGIKLSHPDKLLYPEARLAKRDLARYYEAIARLDPAARPGTGP